MVTVAIYQICQIVLHDGNGIMQNDGEFNNNRGFLRMKSFRSFINLLRPARAKVVFHVEIISFELSTPPLNCVERDAASSYTEDINQGL